VFVAVELCSELKSSTEQLSREFTALTAEKSQIQSSIESVNHVLFRRLFDESIRPCILLPCCVLFFCLLGLR